MAACAFWLGLTQLNFTWLLKSNPITSTPAVDLFWKDQSLTPHAFGVVLSRGMGWQYLQLHLTYVLNIQLYLCRYMKTYIHEFISSHIPTWPQKDYAISHTNYKHRIGFKLKVWTSGRHTNCTEPKCRSLYSIHTCISRYSNGSFFCLFTGAIYEATQRWESVYYYISACCIAAGLLVFITSLTLRFKSKCSQKNKHAELTKISTESEDVT